MERVLAVTHKGQQKIYPLSKLANIKLLQDTFADLKVVIFNLDQMNSPLDKAEISDSRLIASVIAFDRHLDRFSTMVRDMGLQSPAIEYLASNGGTEAEERLKNAIDGLMIGTMTFGDEVAALSVA